MKKPKCIIFDCDGVLIDSEILANRVEVEVKTELGFPISLEDQLKKFVGDLVVILTKSQHNFLPLKAMRLGHWPNKLRFKATRCMKGSS